MRTVATFLFWTLLGGWGTSILAQGNLPKMPLSPEPVLTTTNVTGLGLIVVMVLKAVSDFLQWRTTRGDEKEKGKILQDLAVTIAEKEGCEREAKRWQAEYTKQFEENQRLEQRIDQLLDERDDLRVRLAMAGKEPPSSSRHSWSRTPPELEPPPKPDPEGNSR